MPFTSFRISTLPLFGVLAGCFLQLTAFEGHASAQPQPINVSKQEPSKDARAEAEKHYKRGSQLFQETDFRGALAEFRKSYEVVAEFRVLYNIGQTEYQLNEYAASFRTLTRYLKDGGVQVPAKRKADVEKDLQTLSERVAHVTLTVSQADAEVFIDDTSIGTSPFAEDVMVSAGKRTLRAEKKGFQAFTRNFEIAGSEVKLIALEMLPIEEVRIDGSGAKVPIAKTTPIPWPAYVVTGALALGGAVTGVLALGASQRVKDAKASLDPNADDLSSHASSARTLGIVTDVLLASAIVAGTISVVLTLKNGSKKEAPRATLQLPGRASSARARTAVSGDAKLIFTGSGVSAVATW